MVRCLVKTTLSEVSQAVCLPCTTLVEPFATEFRSLNPTRFAQNDICHFVCQSGRLEFNFVWLSAADFVVNPVGPLKGELVLSRFYRDDVSRQAADAFRTRIIAAKNFKEPVVMMDNASFMYARVGDVYIVCVTKMNVNTGIVFEFIYKLVELFKAAMGGVFDEEHLRANFVVAYELLDETMDHGYPQVTGVDSLMQFMKVATIKADFKSQQQVAQALDEVTGAVDWRQKDKYKYRRNEVFIDVLESVNLLMSSKGQVLKSDVAGKINMKTYLTGMPECKFGMNDKILMEKEAEEAQRKSKKGASKVKQRKGLGIAIDDVVFHRCVRLGQFNVHRTVSFIPPDGQFELMRYRITQHVNLPFKVIPVVTEHGRARVEYQVGLKANFSNKLTATNVIINIPVPPNTAKVTRKTGKGKATWVPEKKAIVWKIKKFRGQETTNLKGEARLIASISNKAWPRPPITMEFQIALFTSSGLHVKYLKVIERSDENYHTVKWVRYITHSGRYEVRI